MFKFITSKPLWVNILAGIIILIIMIISFFLMLDWITGHNKYEKVPSVLSQNIDAARINLAAKGFTVEIADSVYDNTVGALSVVKQSPDADALVKQGRTIYLTINRAVPPQVTMPNLVGFSSRSAEMYLTSLGLKMGDTYYRPDIARNAVLEQRYNDEVIKEGTKIPLGSIINLVLGTGEGAGDLPVPELIGLTLSQARNQLITLGLNIGSVVPVDAIKDTANAFIVKQNPEVESEPTPGQKIINKLKSGQLIDVYISNTAPIKDTITSH
ncbi:MAG: PASTA domain-containing protein [Bacteroidota bacterium]|nr:PASTA domain-containing protein [Bacteroidota bacterium]